MTLPVDDHENDPKAQLREQVRAGRRDRPEHERQAVAAALAVRLGAIPEVAALVDDPAGGCVAAYASYGTEPGTEQVRALLDLSGVEVLLPVIGEDGGLDWAWDSGPLAPRPLSRGIPEPAGDVVGHGADGLESHRCRVVLVPALAVDRTGARLGKGAAYYDRLLAQLDDSTRPPRPLLVAVVHDDEVLDHVPTEPHDQRVDAILTPGGFLRLA